MPENLSGEFILSEQPSEAPEEASTKPTDALATSMTNPSVAANNKPHFFSSFCYYPTGVKFQDQEPGERVILLIRKHFITNFPWIFGLFILGILPPALFIIGPLFFPPIIFSFGILLISTLFYYLILFTFTVVYFTLWYFNVGLVTNKRIIDVDVHNILVRVLSEARLNAVQDVTVTQIGGIRSFFNYGDVDVQTEALKQNIEFYQVPKPNTIRTIIGNLIVNKKG